MSRIASSLRKSIDRRMVAAVAASGLAVCVLIAGPLVLGQRPTHRFLLWNLALAWIPFVAALALERLDAARRTRHVATLLVAGVWLVFLPNAPYLVSDLSHFDNTSATPWLDLARLVSFAWAGCLLAVLSLQIVHGLVARLAGAFGAWAVVVAAALGSGFGVALGRFSRLNSWQLVTHPRVVVSETARLLASERRLAVALFFGLLLLTMYAAVAPAQRHGRTGASA